MRFPRQWVSVGLLGILTLSACGEEETSSNLTLTEPEMDSPQPTPPSLNPLSIGVEGFPTPGEVRTGFIYDPNGQPIQVTYEIQDGLAIWQGDIVIGNAEEIPTSVSELDSFEGGPFPGVVIDDNAKRWPGGVIPYTIAEAKLNTRVMAAIETIENQTPGVTLVPRDGETNYVTFQDGGGCSSPIGMQGDQQFVTLADGCSAGNAAHEILHALGMYHEHTRCDRDTYVIIDYDEVDPDKIGNFYKAGSGSEDGACSGAFDIGTYDPGSMMHYPQDAFAIGSNPTIIPKAGVDGSQMGQRSQVGPTDAETIDQLYGSNNAIPSPVIAGLNPSYPEGSPVLFDATGSTDDDDDYDVLTFSWSFGDGTCSGGTPPGVCTDDDPDHTYADNGIFDVEVTVSDGFDDDEASTSVTITNVAPEVSAGSDDTIDEGDEFAQGGSFTDPGADTWSATVDYGDLSGSQALALSGKSFSLQHTYVDNGVNTVLVTVTDDDGGEDSDDVEVTVNNVAPSVNAGSDATVDSGETFDFSGMFSDPGVIDDPWAWTINWGFGEDTEGSTDDQSAAIQASRQVCLAGDYTVRLTVTDKDGGLGLDELTLTVPYIPVMIDILPGSDENPISLKKRGRLPVVIFGSLDLEAGDIDPSTLVLGDEIGSDVAISQKNNGTYEAYMEDVNDDGLMDLVAMFPTADLVSGGDLDEFSSELALRGFMGDECTNIRGTDTVTPTGF